MINSKDELMERLDIIDLKNIGGNPQTQEEFVKLSPELSPELLKDLIMIVPDLTKVFTETIKCMDNVGKSLEETKRLRWEVIRDIAKSNVLTGKEVLDAIELLKEIEINEQIDWESIFKARPT